MLAASAARLAARRFHGAAWLSRMAPEEMPMRRTTIATALLTAAALGAAAADLAGAGGSGEADGAGGVPATASLHVTAGRASIALHAAALGDGREGWPAGVPAFAHLSFGVALPDLGLHAVHSVSFAAPRLAGEGSGPASRLVRSLGGARLRARIKWQAAG
ncbi:hypothetical protein [Sorangium cellulosum]|nr:hypothetical protein [Sorangium cellulosum]